MLSGIIEVDIKWDPAYEVKENSINACSYATSGAFNCINWCGPNWNGYCPECLWGCKPGSTINNVNSQSNCLFNSNSGYTRSLAWASGYSGQEWKTCHYGETNEPSLLPPSTQNPAEMHVAWCTRVEYWQCLCDNFPFGITSGGGGTTYSFDLEPIEDGTPPKGGDIWSATMKGSINDTRDVQNVDKLTRQTYILGDDRNDIGLLMYVGNHILAENMYLEENVWECLITIEGNEQFVSLKPYAISFDDQIMNVTDYLGWDDKNRFNENDVAALQWVADNNPTDPFALSKWNFYPNGNEPEDQLIDDQDVAFMQKLVDLELDSGVFGDLNGDGEPDCDNRCYIINNGFGYNLEDPEYRVELDYDLDGDNDDDDRLVFMNEICPGPLWPLGDMNCDCEVNFGDINPFVLALSNPAIWHATYPDCNIMNGDINGDGNFDFGDINPFVALLSGN